LSPEKLKDTVVEALEDLKGVDIQILSVTKLTQMADFMVVATGTSNRHVKSLIDSVVVSCKEAGQVPKGVEGKESGEWVLVDLGDVLVHVMQDEPRKFYDLERLWTAIPGDAETQA